MISSATIKLFLPHGDPHRLRTAEISSRSGKSVVAPRTDLDDLFARTELTQAGIYLLFGVDPETGRGAVYVGEAEPSAAAGVVHGGGANGLISWRDAKGRTLREIEGG